ncbi:MFS transporter, MHS family, proline/betaine transporter [Bosea sp. OK403]|uniref:MFS transporter n=1 Tax=Bosea sp. OK403 TaxID=1855286 RepID=UPI0008E72B7A|nr:MFS transporter [Bosea sp. OK403]SFH95312.1 MFS transporter, MHS family, proline/betaine transporter [Bosea sp. OK403]
MTESLAAPLIVPVPARRSSLLRTIIATNIGAVFEWYDLVLYAMFVVTLSKLFFPTGDPAVSVLLSLGTFASAWLVRPLGAIVIGAYADRAGRKPALILSAGLMMLGTLITAILPGYATIGLAAPILLLLARMIQGFSAGGEFGSATAMLIEQDPSRRGFYGATQWASSGFAVFIASMFAYLINASLTPEQVMSWGWRVPFLFGLLIGPVAWYIRQRVDESAEFEKAEQSPVPLAEVMTHDKLRVLAGAGIVAAGAAGSFMNTYMPTFATTKLGLDPSVALIGTIFAGLINSTMPFFFGHLSDRVGRIPLMGTFAVLGLVMTYPMFQWLVASPSVGTLIAIQAMLALVLYCGYYATAPALLSELYQTRRRVTGISISYVLGQLLFGGVTPLVVGFIVGRTGNPTDAGLYLTAIIFISLVSLWGCRRLGVR